MEQPKEQPIESVQGSKNIWITTIAIIVTALIVGGGIYVWQKSNQKNTEQGLQQQISALQSQINQLQQQNDLLQKQEVEDEPEPQSTENLQGYELINEHCNEKECLFNKNNSDYPIGIATVKGYYTKYLDKAWGEEKYCDSLTLTGGTQELINSLIRLIDKGNTIHDKNESNQPIVIFNINNLNEDDKQKFLSSTKNNPVELTVFQQMPGGMGVAVCFNSFDILEVN